MTLEQRYLQAGQNTYVGKVRTLQGSDSPATRGVNFMDGTPRAGGTSAPDEFQDEFTRNKAGAFKYGGEGKVPGSGNSYILSRWLDKSLKIAFDGVGPTTQPNGYWGNSRFTTISDVRNGPGTQVHNWTPNAGKDFITSLTGLSKSHVITNPSGPSPSGIQG